MTIKPLQFQQNAINQLQEAISELWNPDATITPQIILESPTGSGKTLMACAFIDSLQTPSPFLKSDLGDVAFFWITLNGELAEQSRGKFRDYLGADLRNTLSTLESCFDVLRRNEVLFANWQKLSQTRGIDRLLLRRPADEIRQKEQGVYFEDIMEKTHEQGRHIVMIIDESHANVETDNSQELIKLINPSLILKISATPFKDEASRDAFQAKCYRGEAAHIEIDRQDVVASGLIKEEIVCQSEDELRQYAGGDIDEVMLDLAIDKRNSLKKNWQEAGYCINPLVLIQLPNDDNYDNGESKESFCRRYLKRRGVKEERIVTWLADKPLPKELRVTDNDSQIEFLLFKMAAGTGWDCPRAHVLVMFREIMTPVFHKQTLGRIVRMPVNANQLYGFPALQKAYLYTNYARNQVASSYKQSEKNKPKFQTSKMQSVHVAKYTSVTFANAVSNILAEPLEGFPLADISNEVCKHLTAATTPKELFSPVENKSQADKLTDYVLHIISESTGQEVSKDEKRLIAEEAQIAIETITEKRDSPLILDSCLKTDFLPRADYGDLGKASTFQRSLINSLNEYFGISRDDSNFEDDADALSKAGIDITPSLKWGIMVNATFLSSKDNEKAGETADVEVSVGDVERWFTNICFQILADNGITNVARSWATLKEALRQWLTTQNLPLVQTNDQRYRIFIKDYIKSPSSAFMHALKAAFRTYEPIRQVWLKQREEQALAAETPFTIKTTMHYTEDYEVFEPSSKSIQQPFYLRKEYEGRNNETSFIRMLEKDSGVYAWFKNGDSGKESFAIKYYDSTKQKFSLFYPDWIVLYHNGDIGIYDTKKGNTSVEESPETRDKLVALMTRISDLNKVSENHYLGGIYEPKGGTWELITTVN